MKNLSVGKIIGIIFAAIVLLNIGKAVYKKVFPDYIRRSYLVKEDREFKWSHVHEDIKRSLGLKEGEDIYLVNPQKLFIGAEVHYAGMMGGSDYRDNKVDPLATKIMTNYFILRKKSGIYRTIRIMSDTFSDRVYLDIMKWGNQNREIEDKIVRENCMSGKEYFEMFDLIGQEFIYERVEKNMHVDIRDRIITEYEQSSIFKKYEEMNRDEAVDIYLIEKDGPRKIENEIKLHGMYLEIKFKKNNFVMLYKRKYDDEKQTH